MLFVEINSQWRLVQVCVKQFGEGKDKDTETLTTLSVITIQFTSVLFCRTLMYIPLNTYWVTTYYLKYYKMKENVTNLPTVSTLNTWRASQKKPECDYSPCLVFFLPRRSLFTGKVWIRSHLAGSWANMSGAHHTVHSILPLRHLSSFTAAASFTAATGRRHRRVPTLSGGLERVKWSRDRVVCFTLVTIHWSAASLGPVGLLRLHSSRAVLGHLERQQVGQSGRLMENVQKPKIQHQFITYTSTLLLMFTADPSRGFSQVFSFFLKGRLATQLEKLHLPSELRPNPTHSATTRLTLAQLKNDPWQHPAH